ncbi:CPBP family intramembrane glutamic endopeptidase [Phaeodactylibacter luteus]|uniref:CPBP family intramembrane metalloprotease n=1 Tax=Phaeodactylibacter luteus TaxID=1564516 RepID=A0A5C6RNH5_9BACT|nr:type II CAAX endopeptidase family protein [Phaeodactylibacter luteus]TXB63499.1 CPBP family intramembrane metalloprotease [Phaeodactylibacter luteus]
MLGNHKEAYNFSPIGSLLLLALLMMLCSGIGSALGWLTARSYGLEIGAVIDTFSDQSPLEERNLLRWINFFSQLFTFTVPAVLLARMLEGQKWLSSLQLHRASRRAIYAAAGLYIFGIFILSQAAFWFNQQLPLPSWADQMEGTALRLTQGLLVMESPAEFLLTLLVVAVLPALGEELVFRGVVQQQLAKAARSPAWGIWLSAAIFSAFHLQFAGFLPRLLLGAGLGYLFLWSRSLWVPIAAHFLINGMQIAGQYIQKNALAEAAVDEVNWPATTLAGLLVAGLSYYLYGQYRKQEPTAGAQPPGHN